MTLLNQEPDDQQQKESKRSQNSKKKDTEFVWNKNRKQISTNMIIY